MCIIHYHLRGKFSGRLRRHNFFRGCLYLPFKGVKLIFYNNSSLFAFNHGNVAIQVYCMQAQNCINLIAMLFHVECKNGFIILYFTLLQLNSL